MARLPNREEAFLTWTQQHLALWAATGVPPTIGLTDEQVASAQAKLDSAQALRSSAIAARLASVTRTSEKDAIVGELRSVMGGLVGQVDGFARATEDESVYDKASIPKPKDPEPRTEAPVPAMLALRSTTNGNLVLTFEANKGQGSVFVIQRRYETVDGVASDFQYQDTTGEKAWTDTSVPGGLKWIGYQVATRLTNNVLSDWSDEKQFNFGTIGSESPVTGGGEESLTIEDAQALKDAQTAKGADKAG
ncbi:MAG: hypothetical protein RIE77_06875 [Phycisphaerales bacterium]|jgi:hypothetical protein